MSEQNTFVASDETVGQNRKPNRKAPKQISFRVSESEKQSTTKDWSMLVKNANQIARYYDQHQYDALNYEALERDINELRERLNKICKILN